MVKIQIDSNIYEVEEGKNLLEACIALGIDLPYFCYHPAMGSVGACRQCAVKKYANADDKKGRIIMACMEPVAEGLNISVKDIQAADFRASVIEGLMTNHPHDCPVCDEGGECHLQDMTVMTGHNYRRFDFKKRTHVNQNLGPFIHHEMNRCIQCYRCVRFYRDYAGGHDLNVFSSANHVYFGREKDGVLESEFSGNLVEVCPTGVFTDKTLQKHYTRKWDLTNTPSVCVHCSLGCNTLLSERYGTVRRTMSRYNGEVNSYFLCDRGRFGYEFINHPERIKQVLARQQDDTFNEADFSSVAVRIQKGKIIGIGSPRASLESNFALMRLTGKDKFFHGVGQREYNTVRRAIEMMKQDGVHIPSLRETEKADAILILGEDITQTAPVLALSIRQAVRNKALAYAESMKIPAWNDTSAREIGQDMRSPLYIINSHSTKLDNIAKQAISVTPDEISRTAFAFANAIHKSAPEVKDISDNVKEIAKNVAADLMAAERPLIIAGTARGDEKLSDAVENLVTALVSAGKTPWVMYTFSECNSVGLGMMDGGSLSDAFAAMQNEPGNTVVIIENDLFKKEEEEFIKKAFGNDEFVILVDHFLHSTAKLADNILPAATYAESSGTLVNNEGRAQRFYPVLPDHHNAKESWKWLDQLKQVTVNESEKIIHFDDLVETMTQFYPDFVPIRKSLPNSAIRYFNEKIARQTHRFSGRTAITANISVSEPKPPEDDDSPLKFSMEGFKGVPPANLTPYYWWPGWNSPQAINKYLDEPNGSNRDYDPGIRLIEGKASQRNHYVTESPKKNSPEKGTLQFFAVAAIFGSEELSARGQAISTRIPEPFILISSKQRDLAGIQDDSPVQVTINNTALTLKVKTDDAVPEGAAGISWPLPGLPYVNLPAKGKMNTGNSNNTK
jgi:NADH-quinone oxidoreductase subunit G